MNSIKTFCKVISLVVFFSKHIKLALLAFPCHFKVDKLEMVANRINSHTNMSRVY